MASSSVCSISCSLCSVALPNAWDRRLLHSAASSPVLNTVRGVAAELFFCDVDEVFSPPGSHLCRVCVRAVEKLSTLRQKIRKEKTLRELVERAGKTKGCSLRRPIGTKYYTADRPLRLHSCYTLDLLRIAYFMRCSSCERARDMLRNIWQYHMTAAL